mmetsp:Transcript_12382/g.43625  ORF Transcript_12382/g.43625 Transcript_12382/m.43625 type:complete len:233 (+) Transcript_12382:1387-2085(+)
MRRRIFCVRSGDKAVPSCPIHLKLPQPVNNEVPCLSVEPARDAPRADCGDADDDEAVGDASSAASLSEPLCFRGEASASTGACGFLAPGMPLSAGPEPNNAVDFVAARELGSSGVKGRKPGETQLGPGDCELVHVLWRPAGVVARVDAELSSPPSRLMQSNLANSMTSMAPDPLESSNKQSDVNSSSDNVDSATFNFRLNIAFNSCRSMCSAPDLQALERISSSLQPRIRSV